MQKYGHDFVVIFGSTAAFMGGDSHEPHDIDVVFGGSVSESDAAEMARSFVRGWAKNEIERLDPQINLTAIEQARSAYESAWTKYGEAIDAPVPHEPMVSALYKEYQFLLDTFRHLAAPMWRRDMCVKLMELSIESHRVRSFDGTVPLTVPAGFIACGGKPSAIVVFGDVTVQYSEVESLPGIIRVHHAEPVRCAAWCIEYLRSVGMRIAGIHREFNMMPWDGRDDAAYTRDGITAVQNARRQCTPEEWSTIVDGLGDFGPVLEAMSTSKGLDEAFRAAHRGAACAGGDGVLCLDWAGKTFFYPYGNEKDRGFTFKQIADLLNGRKRLNGTVQQPPTHNTNNDRFLMETAFDRAKALLELLDEKARDKAIKIIRLGVDQYGLGEGEAAIETLRKLFAAQGVVL